MRKLINLHLEFSYMTGFKHMTLYGVVSTLLYASLDFQVEFNISASWFAIAVHFASMRWCWQP